MRHWLVFLCAAASCAASVCSAAETPSPTWRPEGVRVTASASPTRVTVGDPICYTLAVSAPEGLDIVPPPAGTRAGDFSLREIGRTSPGGPHGARVELTVRYDLRVYKTGGREIPPFVAVVRNRAGQAVEVDGGAVAVVVESVLDEGAADIRDIKPPLTLSSSSARLIAAIAAAAVVLAAVAAAIARRLRRRGPPPSRPPRQPHEVALDELRRLRGMHLPAAGRVKECYILLSGIARRYIEARFGLQAPDRTTEEFLMEAGGSGLLDARARALVADFLEQCDLVKFARYAPTDAEVAGAFDAAERFVNETRETAGEAGDARGETGRSGGTD